MHSAPADHCRADILQDRKKSPNQWYCKQWFKNTCTIWGLYNVPEAPWQWRSETCLGCGHRMWSCGSTVPFQRAAIFCSGGSSLRRGSPPVPSPWAKTCLQVFLPEELLIPIGLSHPSNRGSLWSEAIRHKAVHVIDLRVNFASSLSANEPVAVPGHLALLLPPWLQTQGGWILFWDTIHLWNCRTISTYFSHARG